MATKKLVGLRIDGNQFAVAPCAGFVFVRHSEAVYVISHGFKLVGNLARKLLFEVKTVGQILVMEARRVRGLLNIETVVNPTDEVVGNRRHDCRAAGTAENKR